MKATGIVRRIDDLGRINIPKEIRKQIFGTQDTTGKPMEFFMDGNNIVLQKYESEEKRQNKEIRAKAIDEFAERLKDLIAKNVEDAECSDDLCCEIFQSEIDEIAEEMRGAV